MQPHSIIPHGKVQRTCEHCGNTFLAEQYKVRKGLARFCSRSCKAHGAESIPIAIRFWTFVDKRGPDECWPWTGSCTARGYGKIWQSHPRRTTVLASRVSWEIHFGPIPNGLFVCHNCPDGDNPSCVNPRHLWLGTQMDNQRDMAAKGRQVFQQHPERAPKGIRNGGAKLSEAQVLEIRTRHRHGNAAALSREYGIGPSTVKRIVGGKGWLHLLSRTE